MAPAKTGFTTRIYLSNHIYIVMDDPFPGELLFAYHNQ
jgi:hypothetical protein